jgi:hypothetical protein
VGIGQDARGEVVFVAGMFVDRAGGDAGEQLGFVVRADGGEDLAAVFARLVDEPGDLLELEGLLGGDGVEDRIHRGACPAYMD